MKKLLILLVLVLVLALGLAPAFAGTVTQHPYGVSVPQIYDYSAGVGTYYLDIPTLSANDTFCGLTATQTLTNKTLTSPTITGSTLTTATLTSPTIANIIGGGNNAAGHLVPNLADDTFCLLAATQTLTGKTLTSPTIANIIGGGNNAAGHLVPNLADDTFTLNAASQTLTNKTLTSPVINYGITNKAAHYTVTSSDCGYTFTNRDAPGAVIFNLPDASTVSGCSVTFSIVTAQIANVEPNGSDQILGETNTGGDYIQSEGGAGSVGNSITLQSDGTGWLPNALWGAWAEE